MENKKVAGGHRIGEGGTRSIVRREGGFQLLNKRCAFLESRFVFLLCENIGVQLVPCSHVVVKKFSCCSCRRRRRFCRRRRCRCRCLTWGSCLLTKRQFPFATLSWCWNPHQSHEMRWRERCCTSLAAKKYWNILFRKRPFKHFVSFESEWPKISQLAAKF